MLFINQLPEFDNVSLTCGHSRPPLLLPLLLVLRIFIDLSSSESNILIHVHIGTVIHGTSLLFNVTPCCS
jgi:hypothetical protein